MTKPWEETWTFDDDNSAVHFPDHTSGLQLGGAPVENSVAMGRLQLAAAAPEMARMLMRVADLPHNDDCPVCNTWPHADECKLILVLRKAGVAS